MFSSWLLVDTVRGCAGGGRSTRSTSDWSTRKYWDEVFC
jgi:hypothetical protein